MTILTKLDPEEFQKILEEYNLGNYKSHKHVSWALQNTIYIIKTTQETVVLKIFENSELPFINFQLQIMQYIAKHKIPVAEVILTKKGKSIFIFKGKKIMLQKFLNGKVPRQFTFVLIKDIAQKLGALDKTLLKLPLQGKFVWTLDHEFKKKRD